MAHNLEARFWLFCLAAFRAVEGQAHTVSSIRRRSDCGNGGGGVLAPAGLAGGVT